MAAACGLAGLIASGIGARTAAAEPPAPTVVELFTSQGCSSCPSADALLGELAERKDVLALSFHVDYWDYIGWADPFASADFTRRQRAYAGLLGQRYVYTPQIVVDGRRQITGSNRVAVEDALAEAAGRRKTPIALARSGNAFLRVDVPAGASGDAATIWMVTFDERHETKIARGENAGRMLVNRNVVRSFQRLGVWTGPPMTLEAPVAERGLGAGSGCAVLLQSQRTGEIIGVGILAPPAG